MAFLFKQTLIFEGQGHGWGETLYFERPTGDVQAAIDFTLDYRNKRRPLLGAENSIIGQRTLLVQDDTGARVLRQGLVNVFGPKLSGTGNQPAEDTGTSLLTVWSDAASRYKKALYMGGAWRAIFPGGDVYEAAGGWQGFFNSWRTLCITLGLGWRRRVVTNSYTITGYTTNALTGITTYTVRSNASIIASFGERRTVGVEFFKRKSSLDGVQVVVPIGEVAPVAPATDWFTTLNTADPRPSSAFTTPGQMRLFSYVFVTPQTPGATQATGSINPVRPVNRKRGRPLLVSVGRQPNRVRF